MATRCKVKATVPLGSSYSLAGRELALEWIGDNFIERKCDNNRMMGDRIEDLQFTIHLRSVWRFILKGEDFVQRRPCTCMACRAVWDPRFCNAHAACRLLLQWWQHASSPHSHCFLAQNDDPSASKPIRCILHFPSVQKCFCSSLFSCGAGVNFFVCDAAGIYGLAMSWMYVVLAFSSDWGIFWLWCKSREWDVPPM